MLIESLQEFWEKYRIQIIIGGLVVGILGFLFLPGIGGQSNEQQSMNDIRSMSISQRSKKNQAGEIKSLTASTGDVYVDIKGAVLHPGAYQMAAQQRVGDAVQKAGGYTPEADPIQVNLAQKITDQMVIYIPRRGEKIPIVNSISGQNSGTTLNPMVTESNSNGKVNLNTATLEQLKGLTGVGEKKAQKILEYRQQHGQFKSVEELKNVNGFGEKSLATLAEQICV
ncbi:helix-hairpin-helix domain-containing protein [Ligilactobacillus araffinosus]|uniref:ComEA protein n=1 Tax=Ligilactobacillus araffinosus DSM 20653 TaxID=1423820 RepID=A0A0R1ZAY1_9LACO|nr:helix-hairpin-helix domain-containing protein [Ligilactobacillus araffinosus]KRM51841.1 comEA protein [Ligilactobacillus araffinosus DSM 20653]